MHKNKLRKLDLIGSILTKTGNIYLLTTYIIFVMILVHLFSFKNVLIVSGSIAFLLLLIAFIVRIQTKK